MEGTLISALCQPAPTQRGTGINNGLAATSAAKNGGQGDEQGARDI